MIGRVGLNELISYSYQTKKLLKCNKTLLPNIIDIHRLNTYFFLGAPVKLCSWLPLPQRVKEQYLAVVYRQEMFKFIKLTHPKQHHSIVLLFKVTQKNKVPELNIHYGFMVNDGPIHNLSFLPSGGYDESTNRLGLVAIATINSCIKVYCLPLNIELSSEPENCSSRENITLIDVKPSFLLNLDILQQQQKEEERQTHLLLNTQCLQINWSEYSGHQHIFAGFSNGFIGIWNTVNDPHKNLNRFEVDNVINYAPLNYFFVGEKKIRCMALHYDTCGPRWLAISTACRNLIVYDIQNLMVPIIMREEIIKNDLLSMDWCPIWETFLYTYGDVLQISCNSIIVSNPTNIMFQQIKLDSLSSGITQVHYTPVTNMVVAASNNGDVVFLDTKELHYDNFLSKASNKRRALYPMDIKKLDGQPLTRILKSSQMNNSEIPSDWAMYEHNYKEKYGLIFHPLVKLSENDKKTILSEKRFPPVNMIPLMRINTLRCNLNLNSKNLVAVGYENGFLRLVNFNKETTFCN